MTRDVSVTQVMQLDGKRSARTIDMREAAELIGCRIEDISYWLDQEWIASVECSCCQAIYALYDDVLDIAYRVEQDLISDFDTIVAERHEERYALEAQRQGRRERERQKLIPDENQTRHLRQFLSPEEMRGYVEEGRLQYLEQQQTLRLGEPLVRRASRERAPQSALPSSWPEEWPIPRQKPGKEPKKKGWWPCR